MRATFGMMIRNLAVAPNFCNVEKQPIATTDGG